MPGYVAIAFLESTTSRVERPLPDEPTVSTLSPTELAPIEDVRVVRSLSAEELRERGAALRDRRAAVRRAWEQTTFYLFDPESWR